MSRNTATEEPDIRRATLAEINAMRERGELFHDPNAPEGGETLGPEFWARAQVVETKGPARRLL